VEAVVNEPCFPVKVAHGHLAQLMDRGVGRILYPALVNLDAPGHELGYGQVCPYSQTLCYTAPAALDFSGSKTEIVTAPLRMGFGSRILHKDLVVLARRLGARGGQARAAMRAGLAAQADFNQRMRARGREVLASLGPGGAT
jgi:predicted nucleotide-binding protein (sugar kinase/HSP70/actin superfamily)